VGLGVPSSTIVDFLGWRANARRHWPTFVENFTPMPLHSSLVFGNIRPAASRVLKQSRLAPILLSVICLLPLLMPKNVRAQSPASAVPLAPPVAEKKPKSITKHGDRRIDNYFWLREKSDTKVIDYLKAENAYTDAMTAHTAGFRDTLYKEMLARIKETDEDVPYRRGDYFYYSRTEQGKQYKIYARRKGSLSAAEEVLLDLNLLAEGKKFLALGEFDISPDHNWLAYSLDETGFRQYTMQFKNLKTGEVLADRLEKVTSSAWAADNQTLFYVIEDHAKRPFKLLRHRLGSRDDATLFEEKDETFRIGVEDTRSEKFVVLVSASFDSSESYILPSNEPDGSFTSVQKRRKGHEYYLDHHDTHFYIKTNDKGRNFRVVKAPVATPGEKFWKQVIAHRQRVMLEDIDVFNDFMVILERDNGNLKLRVMDWKQQRDYSIDFPEASYSAGGGGNPEFNTRTYRLAYTSFVTPASIFDYDLDTGKRELKKQQPVLGGYDPTQYATAQIKVKAKDGVMIPVSLVYRKSLRGEGPRPLLLYGYGSYGYPLDVNFRSSRLSLLDRGMIFAIAHVRGGGDLGRLWHDDGKLMKKKNTFTDFVAVADALIARQWTASDRLVIQGGSAGGLLMGAVVNMRPELFKAVVSEVPFVDVMNTMLDASLPLTVGEYLEWGNPNFKTAYKYMRSYSPYDNLKKGAYPAMLVETSLNDSQVMYWEPAKYVAKLRTLKTDSQPLLLRTNMDAGHGGASGRYDFLKEIAFTYAFILDQVGLAQ
jgi:oligopeptidase B